MVLTATQVRYLLSLIAKEYGDGYAPSSAALEDGSLVGGLQATLSILLEVALEAENRKAG